MKKLLFCLILLSGCASTTEPGKDGVVKAGAADPGKERICFTERPVGSHIARRVCRTKAEMERARREATELLETTPGQSPTPSD